MSRSIVLMAVVATLIAFCVGVATGMMIGGRDRPAGNAAARGHTERPLEAEAFPQNDNGNKATVEESSTLPAREQRPRADFEQPPSAGSINCKVEDEAGLPCAGVELQLRMELPPGSNPPLRRDYPNDDAWLDATADHARRQAAGVLARQRAGATVADGSFTFEAVPDGNHYVSAQLTRHVGQSGDAGVWLKAKPGDSLVFRVRRAGSVTVRVSTPVEASKERQYLTFRALERGIDYQTSIPADKPSTVLLACGRYEATAAMPDHYCKSVEFEVTEQGASIELELLEEASIKGEVLFGSMRPKHLRVFVAANPGRLTVDQVLQGGLLPSQNEMHYEPGSRRFRSQRLAPGEYVVYVQANHSFADARIVVVDDGTREVELSVNPPRDATHVSVSVRGLTINPSSDHPLSIEISDAKTGVRIGHDEWIGKSGERQFFFREKVLAEKATVTATVETAGTVERSFRPGVDASVELEFQAPGLVLFRPQGHLVGRQSLAIRLAPANGGAPQTRSISLNAAGRAEYHSAFSLQPSSYTVLVHLGWHESPVLFTTTIEVASGPMEVVLEIPELFAVQLDVSATGAKGWLKIEQVSSGVKFSARSNDLGIAMLESVPAGNYRLHWNDEKGVARSRDFNIQRSGAVALDR